MRKYRSLFAGLFCFLTVVSSWAQKTTNSSKLNFDLGLDLMSRYIWRGTQFGGSSPSLQPSAELTISNFALGAWGAYSTDGINQGQEFDLYASFTFANELFTAMVTDFFFRMNRQFTVTIISTEPKQVTSSKLR